MTLILDGYNVLFAAGILGRGLGPGRLHKARLALLNLLAESFDSDTLDRTTVVFDARDPPIGRPREFRYRGIHVRFAVGPEAADTLIEELIRTDSAPKQLTVVSSDHRLQKAAAKRKAKAIDSDRWYADVLAERYRRLQPRADEEDKPLVVEHDPEAILRQFGFDATQPAVPDDDIFPPEYLAELDEPS